MFEGLCCFSRACTANDGEVTNWIPGRESMTITRFDLWWSLDELQLVLQASKVYILVPCDVGCGLKLSLLEIPTSMIFLRGLQWHVYR